MTTLTPVAAAAAAAATAKPKLALSFDVEATGTTPESGSMNMLGIVGVLETATPTLGAPWIVCKRRWCIVEYNRRDERCMREFWDKHWDNLMEITRNARPPAAVALELNDFLVELSAEYDWYFVADPASFDWAWLSQFYDRFGPASKLPIGYKATCIDGIEKALEVIGFTREQIRHVATPPAAFGLAMTHFADDDAHYQAYGYLSLLDLLRMLRGDIGPIRSAINKAIAIADQR